MDTKAGNDQHHVARVVLHGDLAQHEAVEIHAFDTADVDAADEGISQLPGDDAGGHPARCRQVDVEDDPTHDAAGKHPPEPEGGQGNARYTPHPLASGQSGSPLSLRALGRHQ